MKEKNSLALKASQVKEFIQGRIEEFKSPAAKFRRRRKYGRFFSSFFRYLLLLGLCFVIIFPTIQQILQALRAPEDINKPSVIWIPDVWSIENIKIALIVLNYWKALANTIKVSLVSMVLQLVATSLAGYAFARLRFKGSNILFIGVILTIIIPPQALSLTRYLYFRNLGLIQKEISLYMMNALGMGIRSGIFIFIFRQFFRGLPTELEESAQIDGAGVFRTFWSVMLPNARGALVTVALFSFVWAWNDSYYVGLLQISTAELPLLTMRLINASEGMYAALSYAGLLHLIGDEVWNNPLFLQMITNVCALLMMLPLLIGYLFVQRGFVESIERTGIVG